MSDAHVGRHRRRTYFKAWRKFRRLTLEQVAERAGMTAGNISAMERGAQGYTQDGLEALAHALQCDPGQRLMVDPTSDEAIWPIWDRAKPAERRMIARVAAAILSEPPPDEG